MDGAKFRQARVKAGFMTQKCLANAAGVWPNTIGRMERGEIKPGAELTKKLSGLLKIQVEELFRPQDDLHAPPSDSLSAAIQQLPREQLHVVMGLVSALSEGVELDKAFQMAKVYGQMATLRQVCEKKASKMIIRRRSS